MHYTRGQRVSQTAKSVLCVGCLLVAMPGATQTPANTFYVSAIGNESNDGTSPATAVRSLSKALVLAEAKGGGTVRMTRGRFDEPSIGLPANVLVEGNWDPGSSLATGFAKQDGFTVQHLEKFAIDQDLCGAYTCITTSKADRVITMRKPGSALKQLVVIGPDRASSVGSNSYGVVVDAVNASLNHVVIKAGAGGVGRGGDGGGVGSGHCSNGGPAGWVKNIQTSGVSDFCDPQDGGQGESVKLNNRTANGGVGGKPGNSNCSKWPSISYAEKGGTGGHGDTGIEGTPGIAAAFNAGGFARLNADLDWASGNVGGRGGAGSAGGGGGGGGPGGSWNVIYWCLVGYPVMGGRGHIGNRGGCGGEGGGGGYSGGGAFALVVNGARVGMNNLVLFGGQGGAGGKGGDGNGGSAGEVDDTPGSAGSTTTGCSSSESQAGTGGSGGHGGKGGGGGGGSGGNGGPAFTLVKIGTGDVVPVAAVAVGGVFRITGGKVGGSGKGGLGADSKTVAPTGTEGRHEGTITLDLK